MDIVEDVIAYKLGKKKGGGGGGGDTDWNKLEVYSADFVADPPTVTVGAKDMLNRWLYCV